MATAQTFQCTLIHHTSATAAMRRGFFYFYFFKVKTEKECPPNEDKFNNLLCLICGSTGTKASWRMQLKALQILSVVHGSWSCETVKCVWDGLVFFQVSLWWWDLTNFPKEPFEMSTRWRQSFSMVSLYSTKSSFYIFYGPFSRFVRFCYLPSWQICHEKLS